MGRNLTPTPDNFKERALEMVTNNWTQQDAAAAIGLEVTTFMRILRKETGRSWKELRQEAGLIPVQPRNAKNWRETFEQEVRKCIREGMDRNQTGKALSLSACAVLQRMRKLCGSHITWQQLQEQEGMNLPIRYATEEEMKRWGLK